ncbi:hypothetical protein [Haloplasma contractile]|uniref:Uncharacterized protein n=1 Tax=Haloplasma contractile SSD-17B TaxID=1033810 RepID=U2FL40_9MOLU|nr:hypothetical protein [Haloplasma contractile]ERJ11924.1 hypothetical protein HLPCO_002164 [Haloplasma contractile SSD-17B]
MGYDTDEVVSVGTWFGLTLLLGVVAMIPFVGILIAIVILLILAFSDVNKNVQNWAKASLIWYIIAFVIGIILGVALISSMSGVSMSDMFSHLLSWF